MIEQDSGKKKTEDIPFFRLESLLTAIATSLGNMRRTLDWSGELSTRVYAAESRQLHVLSELEKFNASGPKGNPEFLDKVQELRDFVAGTNSWLDPEIREDDMSLAGIFRTVRQIAKELGAKEFVDAGNKFIKPLEKSFREVKDIHQDLHRVLGAELPKVCEESAKGTLLDNSNWANLMVRIHDAPAAGKFALIAQAMTDLTDDMDRTSRQLVKLEARTKANGATESEEAAAKRKANSLKLSVETMRRRLILLSSAFYRRRKETLDSIFEATRKVNKSLEHASVNVDTVRAAKSFRDRYGIKHSVDDLLSLDLELDKNKGSNPHLGYSLGAIMKHYRDNYQARIAGGEKK